MAIPFKRNDDPIDFALGAGVPNGWRASEMFHYKISVDALTHKKFYATRRKRWGDDIVSFRKSVLKSSSIAAATIPNPLDISIFHPCYILFELDNSMMWYFQSGMDAIRLKQNLPGKYFSLVHLDSNGDPLATPKPVGSECKYVQISAGDPVGYEYEGFSLYVTYEFDDGRAQSKETIDPDIKNNGGDTIPPFLPPGA
ncbi:MAG TPA: nucleotide synthetase [Rhizomicrobium sp.]